MRDNGISSGGISSGGISSGTTPVVILAGGQSRRMNNGDLDGANKALIELDGRPLLDHIIKRVEPQASTILINTNGDPNDYTQFGLPVIADTQKGFLGPLAGVLAGMHYLAKHHPETRHIVTIAADTPFFPTDLAQKLEAATKDEAMIAIAASKGRLHPVFGLWPIALANPLAKFLASGENAKVMAFVKKWNWVEVGFEFEGEFDPFFNINTPDDLLRAEQTFLAGADI